jgi:LuxR family maltose regulon positive regulatory protein
MVESMTAVSGSDDTVQGDSLLVTKLFIPRLVRYLVTRPRLIEQLNAGFGCKLALISAPAGFGKTTLLSEWAAGSSRDVAWVSLDEADNDAARFLAHFVAALQTIQAGIGEAALAVLQSPQSPPPESVLTALINEITTIPHDFALVLDDYQVIESKLIDQALTFLLDHLPPRMHLFIASRTDPSLPLARLRAGRQLVELRAADLRFTSDEAMTFLNQVMGLELGAEQVAALEARTEGWIAGLHLAALSIQGHDDKTRFIHAFTGSQHYILDYLVEEVLQRQSESVQTFLLHTSILDRMTGPLCDAVTQYRRTSDQSNTVDGATEPMADGQTMLARLEHANLFVIPLDDRQRWYRYHRLFSDFLRARLHQGLLDQVPMLHHRASEWYEQNGLTEEAIDHALAAGDFEWAADLIERSAEVALMRSEVATFLGWVEALPGRVLRARPLLSVYEAGMQLMSGRPLEKVELHLKEAVEADSAGSVFGQVAVFRALIAVYQGDSGRSVEWAQRALELLPEDSLFLKSLVVGLLSLNYMYSGDFEAARQALYEAARVSREAGNLLNTVLATCHLAEVSIVEGRLHEARAFYDQALELAVDGQGRPRPIAGMALMGLGALLQEWNDLEGAARRLEEGIQLTKQWGEAGAIQGYLYLALVRQAQGDRAGAHEAVQVARQVSVSFDAMEMDDILVDIVQARLWVTQGNIEAASRWADQRGFDTDEGFDELKKQAGERSLSFLRAVETITLAVVRIAQGRPDEALEILEPMIKMAEARGWRRYVIEILILQALAQQDIGDTASALQSLEYALSLAEQEGFVRIFVEHGARMEDLLRHLASRRIAVDYVHKLLTEFKTEALALHKKRTISSPLFEALSERELEVLRLIAAGLSNKEIAQELVVAISTVKTHINHIYRKLDVSSRTQAMVRAQELNLL